ncbi:hypothetical protein [Planococcus salinarum]|nr:hypothetical protein [Planococcus salinarum]
MIYDKIGQKINLDNYLAADITGDKDDDGKWGPHALVESYAHFLQQ